MKLFGLEKEHSKFSHLKPGDIVLDHIHISVNMLDVTSDLLELVCFQWLQGQGHGQGHQR